MKIVFMGTPQAAVPSLERLLEDGHEIVAVYTQPDRPAGRGNKINFSPVKEFALARNLPLLQPEKIKSAEAFDKFSTLDADVAVVVAYGRILPETFLNAFPKGAINVHFSLLPKYRGAAPVNWAIVNGERKTGVTTMQMDAGLDTGQILVQSLTEIAESETSIDLMSRLSDVGAGVLSETLSRLDEIVPVPQDHELANHAPIMKREDGRIDWQMTAREISSRVRGFQPFPTSYTFLGGQKLTLWRAFPAEDLSSKGMAGNVASAHGDNLIVECGSGTFLKIEEIQPEGKRRMAVRDFLNGFHLKEGTVLGV